MYSWNVSSSSLTNSDDSSFSFSREKDGVRLDDLGEFLEDVGGGDTCLVRVVVGSGTFLVFHWTCLVLVHAGGSLFLLLLLLLEARLSFVVVVVGLWMVVDRTSLGPMLLTKVGIVFLPCADRAMLVDRTSSRDHLFAV